jgi:hypothetical protein
MQTLLRLSGRPADRFATVGLDPVARRMLHGGTAIALFPVTKPYALDRVSIQSREASGVETIDGAMDESIAELRLVGWGQTSRHPQRGCETAGTHNHYSQSYRSVAY